MSSFRPQILFPNHGSNSRSIATNDDSEVEQDVRAMEDETAHLRRNSRAHTTIESSLLSTNPALQFGSCGESSNTSRSREKMRITDMSTPLPEDETPKLKRNKELRKSSSGRGKRISSSFEATGVLCEFTFHSTEVVLNHFSVNRSTTQLCIR